MTERKKSQEKMYNEIDLDKIDITKEPPETEPERQYYFIRLLQDWAKERKKALGRPLYANITTFGCQMNARDSEKILGIMQMIGYEETDSEEADFLLYNTCTVRENANLKVYGRLGHLKGQKEKNPDMVIALCGCMMQEKEVVEKIEKSYRNVDLIFGTHNIFKLAELLSIKVLDQRVKGKMLVDVWDGTTEIVENLPNERKYFFKSGVNIMYGCNNFCSYCIVPYVRGRERSREPEDIIAEITCMVQDGVVEVMLLGQNVNSYGKNLKQRVTFAQLLKRVEKIEGLKRIRFMTSHPKDLSDELIEVMGSSEKICHHMHLPLQSGSSRLLSVMNRHYTKEDYLLLVEKLRKAVPDIALTTDIIVGFPGETEEDFEETLDMVRKAEYDSAFTFLYSKRSGTPAAVMEDQIPKEVAKERFDRLLKEVQQISTQKAKERTGTVHTVLAEEVNQQDSSLLTGRSSQNFLVHFPGDREQIGTLVDVRLEECKGFYYLGTQVGK